MKAQLVGLISVVVSASCPAMAATSYICSDVFDRPARGADITFGNEEGAVKFSRLVSYDVSPTGQRSNLVNYQENYGPQGSANGEITFHGWTQDQTIDFTINDEEKKAWVQLHTAETTYLLQMNCVQK